MLPDALIDRVDAAITGIAHTESTPTRSAQQESLKQTEAFARRSCENFTIGPVRRQPLAVGDELFPSDIAPVMVGYGDTPLVLRHTTHLCVYLSIGRNMLAGLESAEHIGSGVCGIGQHANHARMGEPSPNQFAVPGATPLATRKMKTEFVETFDNGISRSFALEQLEDGANRALHFLIGIEHDLVAIIHVTNRQRELELTFARLVELAAMEARANDVQLGLRKRALQTEHQAVVELRGVVAAILVDHQRAGDGTQLEQAMPILVRARQARGFQREDRSHLTHHHIADQRVEVLAIGRRGVAQISVEDVDLLRAPAERLRRVLEIVLALGALLVEANLSRCRLANVNARHPRQVLIRDLRRNHDRLLLAELAMCRRQERIRPCLRERRLPWLSRVPRWPDPFSRGPRVGAGARC